MTDLRQWVAEVTWGASWRSIAAATGTTHATIQRRLDHEPGQTVLAIARAYRTNPLPGLIAAELLTDDDVRDYSCAASLAEFSDAELAREVLRRIEAGESSGALQSTEFPATGPGHEKTGPTT